jgi:hypothetical protein
MSQSKSLQQCTDRPHWNILSVGSASQKLKKKGFMRLLCCHGGSLFQLLNHVTDFNETSYDLYFIKERPKAYLLTPWSRVLLEKVTSLCSQTRNSPHFSGTWRFFTVLTSARHLSLSWANSIQSPQPRPTSQPKVARCNFLFTNNNTNLWGWSDNTNTKLLDLKWKTVKDPGKICNLQDFLKYSYMQTVHCMGTFMSNKWHANYGKCSLLRNQLRPVSHRKHSNCLWCLVESYYKLWITIFGKSAHRVKMCEIQNNVIAIIAGCRSRNSCRDLIKNLKKTTSCTTMYTIISHTCG